MAGAESVQCQGLAKTGNSNQANYSLLWQLLSTTRLLYRYLTLVLPGDSRAMGTYMIELGAKQTASPLLTRVAWA